VDLLEHLVDVRGIRLDALLVLLSTGCLLGGCLSGLLGGCLGHVGICCKVGMNRICVMMVIGINSSTERRALGRRKFGRGADGVLRMFLR
jgi:hypothetical protein